MFSLHFTFILRIYKALLEFIGGWNSHPMSGCKGKSPSQMFIEGVRLLKAQNLVAEDLLNCVDDMYGFEEVRSNLENTIETPKAVIIKFNVSHSRPLRKLLAHVLLEY